MRRTRSTGCRRASLIKLMFADDEELVRSGLRGMMSGAPAAGIGALRAILALPDPPTVAMLTTFDIDEYVSLALRLGANGFLLKDIDPAALLRAIRDLPKGGGGLG